MISVIRQIRLLLLGLWIGAAIFFGAVVAPALFGVLRVAGLVNANELAGSVVSRLLASINRGGFEIALFLFVTAFFVNRNRSRLAKVGEMISTGILAIMTFVSHWIISARMMALRASLGTIDSTAPTDARRVEFDSLHRYSTMIMGVALLAGVVAFLIASWATVRSERRLTGR